MEDTTPTQVSAPSGQDATATTSSTESPGEAATPAGSANGSAPAAPKRRSRFAKLWQLLRMGLGVWLGLLVVAAGFGLIAFTWSKTAALVSVALQIPYLMSGGLTGLGLILLGILFVNLAVKRREAVDRQRQLEEIREALVQLRASIEGAPEEEE